MLSRYQGPQTDKLDDHILRLIEISGITILITAKECKNQKIVQVCPNTRKNQHIYALN